MSTDASDFTSISTYPTFPSLRVSILALPNNSAQLTPQKPLDVLGRSDRASRRAPGSRGLGRQARILQNATFLDRCWRAAQEEDRASVNLWRRKEIKWF
jgi:hypothetical protein